MSTLSNVTPGRDKFLSQNVGLTANVSSRESLDGVSVRYAPDPSKKWFVLRATYHRELKAYDYLINHGIEAFLPLHRTLKYVDGKRKFVIESYLPNMLFVYASPETVENCVKHTPDLHFLSYYYNHFVATEGEKNPPLVVPYESMVIPERLCHYKSGDMVRVTDGEFKGVEGRVARVSGQQRVVVEVEGVCLISTAYIPSAFIEKK